MRMIGKVVTALTAQACIYAPSADAWDPSYPAGPVRYEAAAEVTAQELTDDLKPTMSTASRPFGLRTLAYPSRDGAEAGYGWDFIENKRIASKCINFEAASDDKYQNSELTTQEITDADTLKFTLNAEFAGSVSGMIYAVKAGIKGSTKIDLFKQIVSKDQVYIARASVVSGISYVGPGEFEDYHRLSLTKSMRKMAADNPEAFRKRCGDGFISSIGNGLDLYVAFHMHDLSTEQKTEISNEASASASMGDVFSASGSSKLSTKIEELRQQGKLDVYLIQQGGGGDRATLPVSLEDIKGKIKLLPLETTAGSRRTFVTVVPYSALPDWPKRDQINSSDLRQRAERYVSRLDSIIEELSVIREDYTRDRSVKIDDRWTIDSYYYAYRHNLRPENWVDTWAEVWKRRAAVIKLLEELGEPACSPEPVGASLHVTYSAWEAHLDECSNAVATIITTELNGFDDFSLWTQLPLPMNEISPGDLARIEADDIPLAEKKSIYAQALYRHWVERIDRVRCSIFAECLSKEERNAIYNNVTASLDGPGDGNPYRGEVVTTSVFCMGEHSRSCRLRYPRRRIDYDYDCNYAHAAPDPNQRAARDICENKIGGYKTRIVEHNSWSGNNCGYSVDAVTCTTFKPGFP